MLSMASNSEHHMSTEKSLSQESRDYLPWSVLDFYPIKARIFDILTLMIYKRIEKYRPKELHELSQSHSSIVNITSNRFPHMLLYGPPGTGKTTTVLACARRLFGPTYSTMMLELNASDDRGIDTVREKIKTFCATKTIFGSKFKLVLLDEADSMTQVAQNALRRIMEKYSDNVRFCLTCNYVGKIVPAIQSRCTSFKFPPLSYDLISKCLSNVIEKEGINVTECGKKALEKLSEGDMRKALNILQATHVSYKVVDETAVYSCLGSPLPHDMKSILEWLLTGDFEQVYQDITNLQTSRGLALMDIITEVHSILLDLDIPPKMRIYLFKKLAEVESNLARGSTPAIQLSALIACFKIGAEIAHKYIKESI